MTLPDIAYWNALHIICDLGYQDFSTLVSCFGVGKAVFSAPMKDFERFPLSPGFRSKIHSRTSIDPARAHSAMKHAHVSCIAITDPAFPSRLKEIASPPPLLYYRGDLSVAARPCLAIVGSRRATAYGIIHTKTFSELLSKMGFVIVSGMAFGIDSHAHTAALAFDRKTIAVLGSGVDAASVYPREHEKLAEKISAHGIVISEHPVGHKPRKEDFPRRNRIISGLSEGVLITEGKEKSGALITARFALEQGKEVFALPGDITRSTSRGPNNLLARGATPVQTIDDILFEFRDRTDIQLKELQMIQPTHHPIIEMLAEQPATPDAIAAMLHLNITDVQIQLIELELAHEVVKKDGMYYRGKA